MMIVLLGPHPLPAQAGRPVPLAGGVDAVVLALARGLARHPGVTLSVITATPGLAAPQTYEADGYTLYATPRPRFGRLTGHRATIAPLRATIAACSADVVHAHSAGIYALAALGCGRPAVITLHGIIYREMQQAWRTATWPARLRWWSDARMEARVLRAARQLIAISPYVVSEFAGRTQARFHTIENPVADRFFDVPVPPPGRERLLCVARVIPRKGILALVEAFGRIAQARPAATLTIVGETETAPEYAQACRDRAAALGVADRVTFCGGLAPEAVQAEYGAADALLLASEQETAPVSIAEAMAAGRAVVATDAGGCPGMVTDGITGRIAPAGDPAALARATIDVLSQPGAATRMGAAGRAAAEQRFRAAAAVDATLAIYEQLLHGEAER